MASNDSSSQDGNLLLVFVRLNSQHAFPIEVDKTGLVQSIHDEIAKKHDIAHDDFKIIFQGKILDNKAPVQVGNKYFPGFVIVYNNSLRETSPENGQLYTANFTQIHSKKKR